MKKGDRVTLKHRTTSNERNECIKNGAKVPVYGEIYTITGTDIGPRTGKLVLGFRELDPIPGYLAEKFRKVTPHTFKNALTSRLADLFEERDGCPETHPAEIEKQIITK
jgi:hypothetical protein